MLATIPGRCRPISATRISSTRLAPDRFKGFWKLTLTGAVHMRYLPEDAAQLRVCLEGQPDDRKVEADPDTGINAKTVKDLRALETWPPGLVVDTPRENYPELTVRIRSKPPPL
jgi:hypothetical protein